MEKQIIEIIERLTGESFSSATKDSSILNDFGIDSLQMVNLFLNLEDEFDVSIDFENFDYEILSTVETLANYIRKNSDE